MFRKLLKVQCIISTNISNPWISEGEQTLISSLALLSLFLTRTCDDQDLPEETGTIQLNKSSRIRTILRHSILRQFLRVLLAISAQF